jgi:lipid-binding SYLF domain-containing protein
LRCHSAFGVEAVDRIWRELRAWGDDLPRREQVQRALGRAVDDGAGRWKRRVALGGSATDFVLLLMSPRSATNILKSKVKLGGDASAAAGPVGRTSSAETDATLRAEILSYSRARGLFAGISLTGSTLRPDNGANKNLYGKEVSAQDIVFKKAVPVSDSAKELLATLQKASPVNKSK